jgi:hypothetical protein
MRYHLLAVSARMGHALLSSTKSRFISRNHLRHLPIRYNNNMTASSLRNMVVGLSSSSCTAADDDLTWKIKALSRLKSSVWKATTLLLVTCTKYSGLIVGNEERLMILMSFYHHGRIIQPHNWTSSILYEVDGTSPRGVCTHGPRIAVVHQIKIHQSESSTTFTHSI